MSEFKVGDIVKRVFDFSSHWTINKPDGEFFEITEVTAHQDIKLRGSHLYFYKKNFDLAKYPNPTHKHKDLIIAWANGADIEYKGTIIDAGKWRHTNRPSWYADLEYRIKPTKSAKEIQIEELEAKAKELLDKITELKGTNG